MYFDPGTGSMIIQLLLASLATVGACFIAFRNNIKAFFRKVFTKKNEKK